jgi:hypothetical protein
MTSCTLVNLPTFGTPLVYPDVTVFGAYLPCYDFSTERSFMGDLLLRFLTACNICILYKGNFSFLCFISQLE